MEYKKKIEIIILNSRNTSHILIRFTIIDFEENPYPKTKILSNVMMKDYCKKRIHYFFFDWEGVLAQKRCS